METEHACNETVYEPQAQKVDTAKSRKATVKKTKSRITGTLVTVTVLFSAGIECFTPHFLQQATAQSEVSGLFDDFDDGILSLGTDCVEVLGENGVVIEQGGSVLLDTTSSPDTHIALATQENVLIGDFDVRIDFSLLSFPPVPYDALTFALMVSDQWNQYSIFRSRWPGSNGYQFWFRQHGVTGPVILIQRADLSGQFRLTRVGSTITGFFFDGTQFVSVGSVQGTTAPLQIQLQAFNRNTGHSVAGEFDNLIVMGDIGSLCSPQQRIEDLIDKVMALNLQQGISNSLDAKLEAALNALDDLNVNNDVAAISSLEAFINAVEAQQGKSIAETDASDLIADAQAIIDLLQG